MRIPEMSPKRDGYTCHTAAKALTSNLEAPIVALMAVNERLHMDRSTITTPDEPHQGSLSPSSPLDPQAGHGEPVKAP